MLRKLMGWLLPVRVWLVRLISPCNVLHIKSLPNKLQDPDILMLHASFNIFCDFVESDDFSIVDWKEDKQLVKVAEEIETLWIWWRYEFPVRDAKNPLNLISDEEWKEWEKTKPVEGKVPDLLRAGYKFEEELRADEESHIARLMTIREYLWA